MTDYSAVTEVSGEFVSQEQINRIAHRYIWASTFIEGLDVLELACGSGQGLGLLNQQAKSLTAGDITKSLVDIANNYYENRINVQVIDAHQIPLSDSSIDVVILFEAIYYIRDIEIFLNECKRVLRAGGKLLITMPNNQLYDFNPSPHSTTYFSCNSLSVLLQLNGFKCNFYGYLRVRDVSIRQKIFRPIKKIAVALNLIPKSMAGKKLLKKLVFGNLVQMPSEISLTDCAYEKPFIISDINSRLDYKVIYCEAFL